MLQIRVEDRARDLRGSVADVMLRYADGVTSAHKGNIEKQTKSDGLHDWAKKKFSFHQSPEANAKAPLLNQDKIGKLAHYMDQVLNKITTN